MTKLKKHIINSSILCAIMRSFFLTTFLFVFIYTIIGCSKDDTNDTINENLRISAQNTSFIISLEELQPNNEYYNPQKKQGFVMNIVTAETYPNMNYSITTSVLEVNGTLIVTLGDIIKPDITLPAFGPAHASVSIPEKINSITFINDGKQDHFRFEVTDKALVLKPIDEPDFISSDYSVYFRRPKNTFAFVCGTNTNNKQLREDFITKLTTQLKLKEYKFEGEGLIPWATTSDGHWINYPTKFYTYSNDGDFDKAGELLLEFSKENLTPDDGVTMSLLNWDGKNYYSWILDVQY